MQRVNETNTESNISCQTYISENLSFDEFLRATLKDLKENNESLSGYVEGDCFGKFMYELREMGYGYSTRSSEVFTAGDSMWFSYNPTKNQRSPCIEFFGSPFTIEKTTFFDCVQGPYYRNKQKESTSKPDHPDGKRKRLRFSKKLGCPAWMVVKCIRIYSDYKVDTSSWRSKKKILLNLKKALKSSPPPQSYLRFYIKATVGGSHCHTKNLCQYKEEICNGSEDSECPISPDIALKTAQQNLRDKAYHLMNMVENCTDLQLLTSTCTILEIQCRAIEKTLSNANEVSVSPNTNEIENSVNAEKPYRHFNLMNSSLHKNGGEVSASIAGSKKQGL